VIGVIEEGAESEGESEGEAEVERDAGGEAEEDLTVALEGRRLESSRFVTSMRRADILNARTSLK
jgi:hypothetical protein